MVEEKVSKQAAVRQAVAEAVKSVGTEIGIKNVNFTFQRGRLRENGLPYMDVDLHAEAVVTEFPQAGYIKQRLVQVNIFVENDEPNLDIIDSYVDAFQETFSTDAEVCGLMVTSPPEIINEELTDEGYMTSLSFQVEYFSEN